MQEFVLRLTPQELNLIGRCLGDRPFREVSQLIAKLDKQLAEQQQKSEAKPEASLT